MPIDTINFTNLNERLQEAVNAVETQLQNDLNDFDPSTATSADMISLQMDMQKWTVATQLQTNSLKNFGDGIKNTVQNIR